MISFVPNSALYPQGWWLCCLGTLESRRDGRSRDCPSDLRVMLDLPGLAGDEVIAVFSRDILRLYERLQEVRLHGQVLFLSYWFKSQMLSNRLLLGVDFLRGPLLPYTCALLTRDPGSCQSHGPSEPVTSSLKVLRVRMVKFGADLVEIFWYHVPRWVSLFPGIWSRIWVGADACLNMCHS